MNTAPASSTTTHPTGPLVRGLLDRAGVLLLLGTLHPDIFATTLAEVSRPEPCGCRSTSRRSSRSS